MEPFRRPKSLNTLGMIHSTKKSMVTEINASWDLLEAKDGMKTIDVYLVFLHMISDH